jgi:hypothetical protein
MCREAMFNWNQRPKRTVEIEANPSLPNGNEIGIPSPSARSIAKLVLKRSYVYRSHFTLSQRGDGVQYCEFVIYISSWINRDV